MTSDYKPNKLFSFLADMISSIFQVMKSRYLYIAVISFLAGGALNIASQTYLHNYMLEGKTLPMLSDLILDNIPTVNVALWYDIFALIPIIIVLIYMVHKKDFKRLPFIIQMSAIFYIARGIFIVLTPFGNPPAFTGSDPLFNGFSKYDIGVYPSGHAGNVFLLFLLVNDKVYKWIIMTCLIIVIITLFLAHGHYSIDILSGLFFAYAIVTFGEKHLKMFDLGYKREMSG